MFWFDAVDLKYPDSCLFLLETVSHHKGVLSCKARMISHRSTIKMGLCLCSECVLPWVVNLHGEVQQEGNSYSLNLVPNMNILESCKTTHSDL